MILFQLYHLLWHKTLKLEANAHLFLDLWYVYHNVIFFIILQYIHVQLQADRYNVILRNRIKFDLLNFPLFLKFRMQSFPRYMLVYANNPQFFYVFFYE